MAVSLLDEMLSADIADELRAKGHDVLAAVVDPALVGLPDDQLLARAGADGRALVTANIKDFIRLDTRYRAAGLRHCGLVLISTKTFPQNRSFAGALVTALDALLADTPELSDRVVFLER